MNNQQRREVWVDPFQTRMALRIDTYLVLILVVLASFVLTWKLAFGGLANPGEQLQAMLREYLPVVLCLLVLVPVVSWDAIRFTHRFVGPLVRFRQAMRAIARGEPVSPIVLRDGDYLDDLRDDFNQMLEALQRRGALAVAPEDEAGPGAEGELVGATCAAAPELAPAAELPPAPPA
jgi:nitrogen fixation/metabolism regulation signal transduction histidine kinase